MHPLCGDRYIVDFDALERNVTPRTRLLVYTSPSNPLGWVATVDEPNLEGQKQKLVAQLAETKKK